MKSDKSKTNMILVPTDFSEVCDNAVKHGVDLAKQINYKIIVLHIVNKNTKAYLKKNNLKNDSIETKLKEIKKKYKSKNKNLDIDFLVKEGNIFKQIGKISNELHAKLIILGTHGKVGFQHITGSYAMKVINSTLIPVIVVQKRPLSKTYKKIVFPIHVSSKDRQKVKWTISIAKLFDATIHMFPKFESESFRKNKIMMVTKQIKNIFEENNVKFVDTVSERGAGNFAKQVVDFSVEKNADLIITMVSKDHGIFDSQDEQIVFNTSQIPVVCINPIKVKKTSWH